jgi:hypothetical protein
MRVNDLMSELGRPAKVRAQKRAPSLRQWTAIDVGQSECQSITHEAQDALTGSWSHDQLLHLL